jgi:F-type H+-transporting ATPase subunit delta
MKGKRKQRQAAKELFQLCLVEGRLDEGRARLVVERLVSSKRRGALQVLSSFQRLVRLDYGRRTAIVESATPLDQDVQTDIVSGLDRRYGSHLTTTFGQNPALIGGVRIKIGSDVYDGTIRARLAALVSSL